MRHALLRASRAAAFVAAALVWVARWATGDGDHESAPPELLALEKSLDPLRNAFNAALGTPRLVAILSPT